MSLREKFSRNKKKDIISPDDSITKLQDNMRKDVGGEMESDLTGVKTVNDARTKAEFKYRMKLMLAQIRFKKQNGMPLDQNELWVWDNRQYFTGGGGEI